MPFSLLTSCIPSVWKQLFRISSMLPAQFSRLTKATSCKLWWACTQIAPDVIIHILLHPADGSHVLRAADAVPVRGQELPGLHWRHWGSCHG